MSTVSEPDILLNIGGYGMFLHVVCTLGLRYTMEQDSALFDELFGIPAFVDRTTRPWFLRGKYFLPWVRGPSGLSDHSLWARLLFVGARLGAMLLVVGILGFWLRAFWDVDRS